LLNRVELIQDGHEHLLHYVYGQVAAVMFNLGYLPGGDHRIKTRAQTTVKALKASIAILSPGGIVTIVIYSGHEGGEEEKEALFHFCKSLNQQEFVALHYAIVNQINKPPSLLVIEKIR